MEDFFDSLGMVPASSCRPRIKAVLEHGGSAMRFDGTCTRMLFHHPVLHRPIKKLPWPLSMLQPHVCEYRVCSGNFTDAGWSFSTAAVFHHVQFRKGEADRFISSFLEGADENEAIFINRH